MNCKRAKAQLALLIGNDLESLRVDEVRRHLDGCGGCRQHLAQLSASLEALQAPVDVRWNPESESLWHQLSVRLAPQAPPQRPHRMNGWAASLTVAAACTAMIWVSSRSWLPDPVSSGPETVRPINDSIAIEPQPTPDEFSSPPRRFEDSESVQLRRRTQPSAPVVPVKQ